MRDVRHSLTRWIMSQMSVVANHSARDISDDVPSREPQEEDPPDQQMGSAGMNALYDYFDQEGSAPSSSASHRSRTPRRVGPQAQGIHEQPPLSAQQMTSLYGIGSRLVMSMGWRENTHLGLSQANTGGLSYPLSNDRDTSSRAGIGHPSLAPFQNPAAEPHIRHASFDHASYPWRRVLGAFPNPAAEPHINRELCPVCLEEIGHSEVVEYSCTHSLHRLCDDGLVASGIEQGVASGAVRCPVCRAPRLVMCATVPLSENRPPQFQAEVALGSPRTWGSLQYHTRLPCFAVKTNPNLRAIAESWIRGFLRQRSYDDYTTLEDAFTSFELVEDVMGGLMVVAELKESWKSNSPEGEVAYHGTSLASIYSILCQGLKKGTARKKAATNSTTYLQGVFVHKHGTRHKARNYMKYFMFPEGFMLSVLLKCRVADPPVRRTCPPDQWCLPECGVQVDIVYFHFARFEDYIPGHFWTWGLWEPKHEAPPWGLDTIGP